MKMLFAHETGLTQLKSLELFSLRHNKIGHQKSTEWMLTYNRPCALQIFSSS